MSRTPPRTEPQVGLAASDAILTLLLCPDKKDDKGFNWGAPVFGKTRLVKELFLTKMETPAGKAGLFHFQFTPGPYGPSSFEVTNSLDDLANAGAVNLDSAAKSDAVIIRLARKGYPKAKETWNGLTQVAQKSFFQVKSQYRDLSYKALLVYVYRTYPEYTINSLIRDEVLDY